MNFESNKNPIAMSNMGHNLDVIASLDPKGYGVYRILLDLETQAAGGSASIAAAKKLIETLKPGDTVYFMTGFVLTPFLKAETDGIAGTLFLARALHITCGIKPVIFCPIDAAEGLARLAGKLALPASIRIFDKDQALAEAQTDAIMKEIAEGTMPKPAACITVEAPAANARGIYHNAAGLEVSQYEAKMDLLFRALQKVGVLTVSIGDLGNEIGLGKLKEGLIKYIPRTGEGECSCGCGGGILADTSADYVVTGTTSDWGAYALAGALAYLTKQSEASPDRAMVEAVLRVEGRYGLIDMLGEPIPAVDGYDLEMNLLVADMIHKLVKDFDRQACAYPKWYEEVADKHYFG